MIAVFVYWCGISLLKGYQVEHALTTQMYSTGAALNANRFVDRQHAVTALAYCDVFITDDRNLTARCEAARKEVPFKLAMIRTGADFIQSVSS